MTTAAEAREAFKLTLNPPATQDWKSDCIFQDAIETVQDYINEAETLKALLKEAVEALSCIMGDFQWSVEKEAGNYHYDAGVFASFQQASALTDKIKEQFK